MIVLTESLIELDSVVVTEIGPMFAPLIVAVVRLALVKFAPRNVAFEKLVPVRSKLLKFAPSRLAEVRFAPLPTR